MYQHLVGSKVGRSILVRFNAIDKLPKLIAYYHLVRDVASGRDFASMHPNQWQTETTRYLGNTIGKLLRHPCIDVKTKQGMVIAIQRDTSQEGEFFFSVADLNLWRHAL